jgi:predicted transcriptional regulator
MIIKSIFNRMRKDLPILLQSKMNLRFLVHCHHTNICIIKKSKSNVKKTEREMSWEELVKNKNRILLFLRNSLDEKVHSSY